jgi:hypothetical protein
MRSSFIADSVSRIDATSEDIDQIMVIVLV